MKTKGKAYWAKVNTLDTKYNQWNILLHVDKEEAAKLKAVGLKVKVEEKDDELVRSVRFARYLKKRGTKGGQNPKPVVVDAELNEFTGLIGNGSEVIVLHKPYKWNNDFGSGVGSDLQGVQIVNLIPYESESTGSDNGDIPTDDSDEGFEKVEGFVAGKDKAEIQEKIEEKKEEVEKGVGQLDF